MAYKSHRSSEYEIALRVWNKYHEAMEKQPGLNFMHWLYIHIEASQKNKRKYEKS